ncbi:MAG: glycosyl hydrolase 108 family protein [Brevundimonas sp.]
MAGSPFPTGDFGRRTSESPIGAGIGAPAAGAAAGVAEAARGFGRELRDMSKRAYKREGETDAARAITAAADFGQTPGLRQGHGVDDQAYNGVMREHLLTQRLTAFDEELTKAEIANPDDVDRFTEAHGAISASFRDNRTGDPMLDSTFEREATVRSQASLRRVRVGQERVRVDRVRGAFRDVGAQGETMLGQSIATASFDDQGAQLVGLGLSQHLERLARFGPREAFTVSGVEFPADPTRHGVVGAEELAQQYQQVQLRTRASWLDSAVELTPDAATAAAMVGQVQEQWAAGNPAFAGLDAQDMNQIVGRLQSTVSRKATGEGAMKTAAAAQLRDMMTAAEYGADYDVDQMKALALASGDPGLAAQVDFGVRHGFGVTPASVRSNAPVGGGMDGWMGFLLDELEGGGFVADDNGAGRAQWGITERSHPEAWKDGRIDRAEAAAIYRRDYWDPIGGDGLPPALASAAASAAVVAGVPKAKEWLAQANGDVERFHDLQMGHFERLARENPAKYGGSLEGWKRRDGLSRARSRSVTASERTAEGYASDPIGFARGNSKRDAMAPVPEFDINRLFGGGPEAGAFLLGRLALGRQLNTRSGVPVAVFDKAELATIKDHIETDPAAVVGLVTTAMRTPGIDPEGVRVMLGQLGMAGTASADLHLGYLATETSTRGIAAKVIQGRSLRAGGAKDVDFGSTEDSIADVARRYAPALEMQPELFAVIQATARDMAIADEARGQRQSAEAYVNSALGATRSGGRRFGGVARVNGGDTLAPTWLRHDYLDDALEIAARDWETHGIGPLYSNGQPIPARVLRGYRLKATEAGTYRLVNTAGQELPGRRGSAFEFNIEAASFRDRLRRQLPGAVLGND